MCLCLNICVMAVSKMKVTMIPAIDYGQVEQNRSYDDGDKQEGRDEEKEDEERGEDIYLLSD